MKFGDYIRKTKTGLQVRMTLCVTVAVLIASAVILMIMASIFRKEYERELDDRISESIASTTQFITQKIESVESATNTFASLVSLYADDKQQIDTILCRSLPAMTDVEGVALAVRKGYIPGTDKFYERCAYFEDDNEIFLNSYDFGEEAERDSVWLKCVVMGQNGWEGPTREDESGLDFVGFYTPLYGHNGERIGVAYSFILLSSLTSTITQHKSRKDIDVSMYSSDDRMIVAPDDYILELSPDQMIVRERIIDKLNWKIIYSADRNIVDGKIRKALSVLSLLILLLFLTTSIVIMFTVMYVARPFVRRQHQTEREKAVMDNEMQLAAGVQNNLVPHQFPPFPGRDDIDLHACLHPARKVGGDLYDYFISDDKLYFCIGDVSGKGVQASLLMAATHYLFRSVAACMPASEAVGRMNRSLCADNSQCLFVTFWFGCLNIETMELEYVNAGHNSPVLVSNGTAGYMPMAENMPLGVWDEAEFTSNIVKFGAEDVLFLYTDGITEAMNPEGVEFGKEKTLTAIEVVGKESAACIIDKMLEQVRQYASGAVQSDDITMLCLRMRNGLPSCQFGFQG